jgi:competence protein ComEC
MQKIIKHWKIILITTMLFANILIWYAVFQESPKDYLSVAFLDVGQGDSILITSPVGNRLLIDGGPGKQVLRQISTQLPFYTRSLDLVMASHPDSDHIGGLPDVLRKYTVSGMMVSGAVSSSGEYQELENLITTQKIPKIEARRGQRIDLGGGAIVDIFFPERDASKMETNKASIIAKLSYGENSFLFVGDTPIEIENYLAKTYGKNLQADVYKVSHHGSKNSNTELFVGFVSPKYGVISVGANNRYGHPNQEVLDLLKRFQTKIFRTDQDGTIIFHSDGTDLKAIKN